MGHYTKEAVKLGRKGAHSTADFTDLFGVKHDSRFSRFASKPHYMMTPEEKDYTIIAMANTIMELTSKGKFNLKDF